MWDSGYKSDQVTLTFDDRIAIASASGTWQFVRGASARNGAGKYQFEITYRGGASDGVICGFSDEGPAPTMTAYLGSSSATATCGGIWNRDGDCYFRFPGSAPTAPNTGLVAVDGCVGVVVDFDAGTVAFYVDGLERTTQPLPAGLGSLFPAATVSDQAEIELNVAGPFQYPIGDATPWVEPVEISGEVVASGEFTAVVELALESDSIATVATQAVTESASTYLFQVANLTSPFLRVYRRPGRTFQPSMSVEPGHIIRPTTFLGVVYRVLSSGELPAEEPAWWSAGEQTVNGVSLRALSFSTVSVVIPLDPQQNDTGRVVDLEGEGSGGNVASVGGVIQVRSEDGGIGPVDREIVGISRRAGEGWSLFGWSESAAADGAYQVQGSVQPDADVFLLAIDRLGIEFEGQTLVQPDDLIRPSVPNGYVYRVVTGGELPATEPDWWTTGQQQVGTATLEAREYLRPLAHGPVDVTFL